MKVAIGNLGAVTFALKASLESLGIEAFVSPPNSDLIHRLSQPYMPSELCYPLKLLLGNYLFNKAIRPDAVIFFSGCDMCNLSPINYSYKEIFNDMGWYPDVYFCEVNSKKRFIISYLNILKSISSAPWYKLASSISIGLRKFESFNFLDQVFYTIRPTFVDNDYSEVLYSNYFKALVEADNTKKLGLINKELLQLFDKQKTLLHSNMLRIGLVGDIYTLSEPFAHQYTDKQLGNMGVILDRWTSHKLLPQNILQTRKNLTAESKCIDEIFKNQYGVFTSLELTKIAIYISRGYDGIVFLSPLECNPNDALRNLLATVQAKAGIPILSLVFDEHTSSMGVSARLEAFVDMLIRRKSFNSASAIAL